MKDCNLIEPLTNTLNLLVFIIFLTQGDPGFEYLTKVRRTIGVGRVDWIEEVSIYSQGSHSSMCTAVE